MGRVIIIGHPKPPQPAKKCGCHWRELPGGTHHGKNIWSLAYEFSRCAKHPAPTPPSKGEGK